jgi:hypothetical protein
MNLSKLDLVPLQQASLCLDCDMITASYSRCFACGSTALMSLAKILNDKECADPVPPKLAPASSLSPPYIHEPRSLSSMVAHRRSRSRDRDSTFPNAFVSLDRRGRPHTAANRTPCRLTNNGEH